MLRDIRKNKTFNRRTLILGSAQSALATILIARLGYLQFYKHREYAVQSDSNRIKPLIKPSPRGNIYDRNGAILTTNEDSHRLLLYLTSKKDNEESINKISKILSLDKNEEDLLLSKIKNARRKKIISLIDNIKWDDLARVETYSHLLPGIRVESGIIRKYPFPHETSHLIGYVSSPSEKEIDENEQGLFLHPDFRIGKTGLEKSFDQSLRGKYGVKYVEVNVHEIPIRTLSYKEPKQGSQINLTIDIRLQEFVSERIKNLTASVVVLDVNSGEILAMVSSPSFNPNNFVEGVSLDYWSKINLDPEKPLNNKVISAIYPPGSTFKPMVALAALEEGIDPKKEFFCNGSYKLGRRTFKCWKKHGHGKVNMIEAISQSCNSYFFSIAHKIGYEPFEKMAKKFGYGQAHNISLLGQNAGLIPSFEWKEKKVNVPWVGGDTLNAAIGQGFILTTPLQLAVATARIANGGTSIQPYLIKNQANIINLEKLSKEPIAKKEHLDIIKEGMNRVVNNKKGSAFYNRIKSQNYQMAGKTGTSQVISKTEDEMTEKELSANANHGLFIGFAPVHKPKYAVSVVVEHGKSGSGSAAPIARDVLSWIQEA